MRTVLLVFVACLAGCDGGTSTKAGGGTNPRAPTVEPDTRPAFVLSASKPFVAELGRGSGLYGLDIIKVDQTGAVELSRVSGGGVVESASLQLSTADVATLVGLVNSNQLTGMGRAYHAPGVADGTQWVLWIQQPPSEKSVYFNNSFPGQITAFANGLDALVQKAGLSAATWAPVPKQKGVDQQRALWARVETPR